MKNDKENALKILMNYVIQAKMKGNMILTISLMMFSVLLNILSYYFTYRIIRDIIENNMVIKSILINTIIIVVCIVLKTFCVGKAMLFSHIVAFNTLEGLRIDLASKIIKQPLGDIKSVGVGTYKRKFTEEIESMELILAHQIPEGIPHVMGMISIIITVFIIDWRMGLLFIAILPIMFFCMNMMMKAGTAKMKDYYKSGEVMNREIIEYISGMNVIKVFTKTNEYTSKFMSSIVNYRDFTLAWYKEFWPWMSVIYTVLPVPAIFMIPGGLYFYITGTISLSIYLLCIMLVMSVSESFVRIMTFMPLIPMLKFKMEQLISVFDKPVLTVGENKIDEKNLEISFENVSFAYGDEDVIKNVSFKVKPNTLNAIVGESGSGKSTLAKLLVHYWDIKDGRIKVGDVDIKDVSIENLMNYISFVEQDLFLFNMSILENIRIGKLDATKEEVIRAAELAYCHEFIEELDNGYDSVIGDKAFQLSGGERQRITIARAILKDSPIIILDEATSHVDPENEDKIQGAIEKLTKNKTVITIAHRLSTIANAKQILVMDKGEVIANGDHEELLLSSEKYKLLWERHKKSMDWTFQVKEVAK